MYPHSLKEELSNGLCWDTLVAGHHNGDLREFVHDHENTFVVVLSRRKTRHLIHRYGIPTVKYELEEEYIGLDS